ncbi:L,D-transpeptidase family protein [Halomonas jincaotanensis]|uniref:L,D-transpeptidase family protein n=1 Tax=Halomonas jincaotanensis TaxID=2810616 RepID=UPI002022BE4E|nr:L,D-transpeptidase family protein [Halomonas jincaotanensis]
MQCFYLCHLGYCVGAGKTSRVSALMVLVIFLQSGSVSAEESRPTGAKYSLVEHTRIVGESYSIVLEENKPLLDIAKEHGVGYEEIRAANPDISIWMPGVGTAIRIPARHILPATPQEGIVINLAELRLYYYPPTGENEMPIVETYPIGIGRDGFNTPLGVTKTTMRLEDPAWYPPSSMREEAAQRGDPPPVVVPPGPDNPLGSHAILLDIPGYLIHGTNQPDGIGMRASRGCIRMHPEDIENLFERIPDGTQVNVVNEPFKAAWDEGQLYVQAFPSPSGSEYELGRLIDPLESLANVKKEGVEINHDYVHKLVMQADGNLYRIYPNSEEIYDKEASVLISIYEEIETRPQGFYLYTETR